MRTSIIIPAYNEEKRIGRTLEEYTSFLNKKVTKDFDYEIIVVINNSKDKTEEIVKKFKLRENRMRYLNFKRGGKGFAITEGFKDALNRSNELIGFVDADMATPPESFYELISQSRNCDGVIANRYDKKSKIVPEFTFRRIVVSNCFNLIVRAMFNFPYKDTQCGAKVFRREVIERVIPRLTITQWAFDIDFLYLARKAGFSIKSCHTIWKDVEGSKIRLIRSSIEMFFAVMQLRILHSPFKRLIHLLKGVIGPLYRLLK